MSYIHSEKSLTKKNWDVLRSLNIIDEGEGNGFADLTEVADRLIRPSRQVKFIRVKSQVYSIAYYSGCFYPCWHRVECFKLGTPQEFFEQILEIKTKL